MPVKFKTEQQARDFAIDDKYQYLIDENSWHITKGYAKRNAYKSGAWVCFRIHRQVLEAEGYDLNGLDVDHVNGNKLDNRVKNLRVATKSQNQYNRGKPKSNTSGFKGVSWYAPGNSWRAKITVNKKYINLGSYKCPIEASEAYLAAAQKYHGEFSFENSQLLA